MCRTCLTTWNELSHLAELIKNHKNTIMVVNSQRKTTNQIHRDAFPRTGRNRQRNTQAQFSVGWFGMATNYTFFEEMKNITLHMWPIKESF
jgi:hypothetical protein